MFIIRLKLFLTNLKKIIFFEKKITKFKAGILAVKFSLMFVYKNCNKLILLGGNKAC